MKEDKLVIAEIIGFGVLIVLSTYDFVRNIVTRRKTSKRLEAIENKLGITHDTDTKVQEEKADEAESKETKEPEAA
jgi:hypothetical protein